jgi:replicative DNA helicase
MVSLFEKSEPVDLITLSAELRARGEIEKIGGEYYLTELTNTVSSAANVEYHSHIVLEKALLRRLIKSSSDAIDKAYDETEDALELVDIATTEIAGLRSKYIKESSISISRIAKETNEEVDKIHTGKDESLKFGFADIDNITGGMRRGNLIVIAGLEKSGKTTLSLQSMFYNAQRNIPCLFFSTEMTRIDLMLRYALIKERISWIKLISKKLSQLEIDRLKKQITNLGKLPIYVSDKLVSIMDIAAESEKMISSKGIRLIVADYIQRIVPVTRKSIENREREIASISSGLKNIAFKHGTTLIALSQLNDDLRARESRSIEQDLDKMITINSPDKNEDTTDGTGIVVGIRIKQRFGAGGGFGDCKMIYDKQFGYWKSFSGIDQNEASEGRSSFLDEEDIF